mmetsp:Transcript_58468/g.163831  ORF Transcript_58468/g.163831 Transcript_58468/m.163831 type:complete len:206 (-) Transcript_58468:17-634(-)
MRRLAGRRELVELGTSASAQALVLRAGCDHAAEELPAREHCVVLQEVVAQHHPGIPGVRGEALQVPRHLRRGGAALEGGLHRRGVASAPEPQVPVQGRRPKEGLVVDALQWRRALVPLAHPLQLAEDEVLPCQVMNVGAPVEVLRVDRLHEGVLHGGLVLLVRARQEPAAVAAGIACQAGVLAAVPDFRHRQQRGTGRRQRARAH